MKKFRLIKYLLITAIYLLAAGPLWAQKKGKKKNDQPLPQTPQYETEYWFIEAEKQYLLKNYAKAIELFNKCLTDDPQNDAVFYKLADIYNRTEQYNTAARYIDMALRFNKKNKYYYLLAVDIYTNLGELNKVASLYEQLLDKIPATEEYLFNLAAVYLYLKDYDKALATYNRAEKSMGLTEQIAYQRQKIYLEINQPEKAIEESRKLIAHYPDNFDYVLQLADILISNKRHSEATRVLQQLLAEHPEVSAARLKLADIYWQDNQVDRFREELIAAFQDSTLHINAKINTLMRYMTYLPNATLQKLIPQLADIVAAKHPDNSNAYLIQGDVYSAFIEKELLPPGKVEKAKKAARQAYATYVRMQPDNFSVWQNLLNLELQLNMNDSLQLHADQALELFPNQPWLYLINGIAQLQAGHYRQAAQTLEAGRRRAANNRKLLIMFYSYLGDIYHELQEHEKSDQAYEAALDLDPFNYTVLNNYSYYLSLRGEKLDKAAKMSTELIRNNPDNNTFLDTYAWVQYALGNYEEARRVFEKIIASGVTEGVYYDHYGDTLYQLGLVDEAVEQWKKARELDQNLENIDQKIAQRKIIQ